MATAEQSKLEKIDAQIAVMQEKVAALDAARRTKAIELVQTIMEHYGLTAEDLGVAVPSTGRTTRKQTKAAAKKTTTVAAKYQDPKTGATWSGRGREPLWIKGKKRDRFLIAK
jgi:DNA-binding protein H-NS